MAPGRTLLWDEGLALPELFTCHWGTREGWELLGPPRGSPAVPIAEGRGSCSGFFAYPEVTGHQVKIQEPDTRLQGPLLW